MDPLDVLPCKALSMGLVGSQSRKARDKVSFKPTVSFPKDFEIVRVSHTDDMFTSETTFIAGQSGIEEMIGGPI